ADMKAQIEVRDRNSVRAARSVELGNASARLPRRSDGGPAAGGRIVLREDGENSITNQLQDIAAGAVDRGDDRLGVIVEKRDQLLGRVLLRNTREVTQIAKPQCRVNAIGDPAPDPARQHALANIAAEISLHERM